MICYKIDEKYFKMFKTNKELRSMSVQELMDLIDELETLYRDDVDIFYGAWECADLIKVNHKGMKHLGYDTDNKKEFIYLLYNP